MSILNRAPQHHTTSGPERTLADRGEPEPSHECWERERGGGEGGGGREGREEGEGLLWIISH